MSADYAVYDGHGFTLEVIKPCWVYAWRTTNLDTGLSWISVYRSPELRDTDDEYRAMLNLIGDAEPLEFSVIPDDRMMFGRGELSVYAMPEAAEL
ncbi:hypothetical protein [Mycolicibacter kumamotonensis]|uniref:Uncharacterized protein n=1 Tax=Mycolicibacter kumamotonensis TaxID=354243 RepID=A0A1B8SK43_9MYCO|nr:hypothetical protein [Mycolicibacter kumamotonensis]OBY33102.1 hypothetical protein ACT18_04580 [Mycolicibacter kumamotonensis]